MPVIFAFFERLELILLDQHLPVAQSLGLITVVDTFKTDQVKVLVRPDVLDFEFRGLAGWLAQEKGFYILEIFAERVIGMDSYLSANAKRPGHFSQQQILTVFQVF